MSSEKEFFNESDDCIDLKYKKINGYNKVLW